MANGQPKKGQARKRRTGGGTPMYLNMLRKRRVTTAVSIAVATIFVFTLFLGFRLTQGPGAAAGQQGAPAAAVPNPASDAAQAGDQVPITARGLYPQGAPKAADQQAGQAATGTSSAQDERVKAAQETVKAGHETVVPNHPDVSQEVADLVKQQEAAAANGSSTGR